MVSQRFDLLPDPARLFVELVAVGGRPLPVAVIAQASGIGDGVDDAIALARGRRLVRAGLRDGREIVEASHDRFRETIVAQLGSDRLRDHHGALADALEAAPGTDPEAVAAHLLGAGRNERAARYTEQAAEEASAKLAFGQAARLFRLTLETGKASPDERRRLHTRLAQILEWSGHSEQ